MSEHSKEFPHLASMMLAADMMTKYQRIHNVIRKDYQVLLKMTEQVTESETEFDAMHRSCVKGLFSMIEADVYGLNGFDAYKNYNDRDSFQDKFKKTFKQIGKTWNKTDRVLKYMDVNWQELVDFRTMRDQLMHPKEIEHFYKADRQAFEKVKKVFIDYDTFINDLMNDFFVGTKILLF